MDYTLDIETQLKDTLASHLAQNSPTDRTPPNLAESIRYSLLSPGKRIRPRLLLACAEMLGLPLPDVVPAALALEMTHCFTLIHDDLPCMDDDDFRRGLLSNHKKFGESLALLAGDGLLALAMEVFLDCKIGTPQLMEGLKRLLWATGPRGVIGGQATETLLNKDSTLQDLQRMHRQKTGALFMAALLIPKDFASISDESEKGRSLSIFADELGLAFQVADDLEDGADSKSLENSHVPTSILFYMTPEKARNTTVESLHSASEKLVQLWGPKALHLKKFSDEIIRKLEKTAEASHL